MLTKLGQYVVDYSPLVPKNDNVTSGGPTFYKHIFNPNSSTELIRVNPVSGFAWGASSSVHPQNAIQLHDSTNSNGDPPLLLSTEPSKPYIILGSGTTPPTVDDYKLDNPIFNRTDLGGSVQQTITRDSQTMRPIEVTLKIGVTNNGNDALTITEIGYVMEMRGFNERDSSGNYPLLVDRTLLDTPLTIPAGESGTIDYTFTVANQSASLNSVSPMRAVAKLAEVSEDDEAESDDDIDPNKFIGLSAEAVWDSLSYRPAKHELHLACDWLGIEYDKDTNAQLKAKLAEAAGVKL